MNDVLLTKKASLERCIEQIRKYDALPEPGSDDVYLRQDAIAINVQRACELVIDMANHLVRLRRLGVPQSSSDSFALLARGGIVTESMADTMTRMVGFRNVLGHRYQDLNAAILRSVIDSGLDRLIEFAQICLIASL